MEGGKQFDVVVDDKTTCPVGDTHRWTLTRNFDNVPLDWFCIYCKQLRPLTDERIRCKHELVYFTYKTKCKKCFATFPPHPDRVMHWHGACWRGNCPKDGKGG